MPEITRAHTRGDLPAMRRLIFTMLRLTGAFSLAAGAGFVVFGAPLAQLVYRDADVGRMVQVLGFVAPFMYLESMVDGVLKGLGEQLATFRYSLLDSVFRIAAICLIVPQYGMAGFLGVMVGSNLLTCGLNLQRMLRKIKSLPPMGKVAAGRMRGGAALLACEWVIAGSLPLISQRAGADSFPPRGKPCIL